MTASRITGAEDALNAVRGRYPHLRKGEWLVSHRGEVTARGLFEPFWSVHFRRRKQRDRVWHVDERTGKVNEL